MKKWFSAAALVFSLLCSNLAAADQSIKIQVNGSSLPLQGAEPYLDQSTNRTMIPVRFVSESLGAKVTWDVHTQKVSISKGTQQITIFIDNAKSYVNGKLSLLQSKPVLRNNRTYVPLRFVSESLGAKVGWDVQTKTVNISQQNPENFYGLYLGQSVSDVKSMLGEPQRKDKSAFGYDWWIYKKDLNNYIQVGVLDNKVVDIFSNGNGLQFNGIKINSAKSQLSHQYTIKDKVEFKYKDAQFTLNNDMEKRVLAMVDSNPVIFYMDIQNEKSPNEPVVSAIRTLDMSILVEAGMYPFQFSYYGDMPSINPPALSEIEQKQVEQGNESEIFDLANTVRIKRGLTVLEWNSGAAQVAESHSLDMLTNHFFEHVSPTTGLDPFQRMDQSGLSFRLAGENIAMGQSDGIEAHEGWMNSIGHRKNILNPGYRTLGVGVKAKYYTQDFITP